MWCGVRATWGLRVGIETAILGAAAVGAGANIFGSMSASKAQANAQKQALAQQQAMFNTVRGYGEPLMGQGRNVMDSVWPTIQRLITPGADQTAALSEIPGFKFAQDWGQKQVSALGSTRGLGGNVLKAGADYATGKAQETFFPMLAALTGMFGQGSGLALGGLGSMASAAGTFSGQMSNSYTNMGNAQASGILGATNAISNFAGTAGNLYTLQGMGGFGGGGYNGYGSTYAAPGSTSGMYGGVSFPINR